LSFLELNGISGDFRPQDMGILLEKNSQIRILSINNIGINLVLDFCDAMLDLNRNFVEV